MRRRWALVTAGLVAAASSTVAGATAKPAARTVVESYSPLTSGRAHVDPRGGRVSLAEIELRSRQGETSISVVLEDASGIPVYGSIQQEGTGARDFCGTTKKPVEIVPAEAFYVVVHSGPCEGSAGLATAGTATVTFHGARGGAR